MMYCAECGTKMERHDHGAWVICCHGWGYWWNQAPRFDDRWFGAPQEHKGFWLYKTNKWPTTLTATKPQLEE
jgi:hypothetical protein